MTWFRRRQALFVAGLLILLTFFVLLTTAIRSVPPELRLLPGEVGRLRVRFPLSLAAPEGEDSLLAAPLTRGTELVFCSSSVGATQVELRLFGTISLRKVPVNVVPERKVALGGQAIGILLAPNGLVVVGHQSLRGLDGNWKYPAKDAGIETGDIILTADGMTIYHAEDLIRLVEQASSEKRPLRLELRRAGQIIFCRIETVVCSWPPEDSHGSPRAMLGLFVEDPAAGVGTLTFYDPDSKAFAALGHRITELGGQRQIWLEGGKIVAARISGVEQGHRGSPGEKIGTFTGPDDIIGTIDGNSRFGIFGRLDKPLRSATLVPVALIHQVHPGPAQIRTVVHNTEIREFSVEIARVYQQSRPHDKGMVIKVSDPELLSLTGGIIQGMSGSPIIQDGRLVGAVTHVFVNDPTRGYGVLAEWMLREMESAVVEKAA